MNPKLILTLTAVLLAPLEAVFSADETALLGRWTFNEGSGTAAEDNFSQS